MDNKRYARQICLPEIGEQGQEKLSASRACVVGAGGLGSPVIYYLAAAGVGHIHIIDPDVVEISNLNRQFLHFERDIGEKKAVSAKNKINAFNSGVTVDVSEVRLTEENAHTLLGGFDIVLACADNIETRLAVNRACASLKTPMIDGGVGAFFGYCLTVFHDGGPCYECIFGDARPKTAGVTGAAAGVIGSMMALQAIKYLVGIREGSGFLTADFKSFKFENIKLKADPSCPVCGHGAES